MNNEDKEGVIHFKDWSASYIPQILEELYVRNVYAPYVAGKKDLVVLDLGFNIGLFSLYISPISKQIYAFEPSKESHDIGTKNLKDNGITNVKLFEKAIAKDDGKITFYQLPNTTANSTMPVAKQIATSSTEVDAIRLDTFIKEEGIEHIDFMKMDIEGAECEVIGGKGFQNIVPILDAFVVEWHDWSGVNVQQLVTTIRDYGYKVELIPAQAVILGCTKIK